MAAAPSIDVRVRGLPQFAAGSEHLAGLIGDTAAEGLGRVADQAGGDVRMQVPYRSGRLAGSVRSALAKSQKKATVRIGARVPYAGWIEFGGTRGRAYVPAGRYLYPTAFKAEGRAIAACEKAAKDEIRGMTWPSPTL